MRSTRCGSRRGPAETTRRAGVGEVRGAARRREVGREESTVGVALRYLEVHRDPSGRGHEWHIVNGSSPLIFHRTDKIFFAVVA